ncbi:MAG: FprA family A-type flavoprotein [Sulfolobales archaeon]
MPVYTYEFRSNIYMIVVNDIRTRLFESLWDIPEGVTYNTYLLIDDKTVLFDGVKNVYSKALVDELRNLLKGRDLNYYVVHHGEPDHSGSFPDIIKEFPNVKVVTTDVGLKILKNLYNIDFNYILVSDYDELSVGKRKLVFIKVPWLHWPDTFVTYLPSDKVLFSCDIFGSYGVLTTSYWDKDYGDLHVSLSKRYFANIVSAYRSQVVKAIEKLSKYEVDVIAPSHGPLVSDIKKVVNLYLRWSKPEFESKVVIVYSSMYGNLEEAVKYVVKGVEEVGVKAVLMKVPETAITYVVRELMDAPAIIFGVPTYDANAFPYIGLIIDLMRIKRFEGRYVGILSSGLWAPTAESRITKALEDVKAVIEGRVSILGSVKDGDIPKLVELGRSLGIRANQLGSIKV